MSYGIAKQFSELEWREFLAQVCAGPAQRKLYLEGDWEDRSFSPEEYSRMQDEDCDGR